MSGPPNPYFINIELFWPNGTRANQNQIARVKAFDVNGSTVTDEGQSGFNPNTGGWYPVYMQNIAAFYPPRLQPNLRFQVVNTQEQVVHTTQVFANIQSGVTVKIIIGVSDEIVGGSGGGGNTLPFTGNAHLVVQAKSATLEQRFVIAGAQNPGNLTGTVNAAYDVVGSGTTPWTLALQQKQGTNFVGRTIALGPTLVKDSTTIQFVLPTDQPDITLRIEQTVTQPGTLPGYGIVHGTVRQTNGQPAAGVSVSAWTPKARGGDAKLGDPTTTGTDGVYLIPYARTQTDYDLYVQVAQGEAPPVTSAVVLEASADETVDVVIGGVLKGPSAFEDAVQALGPVLAKDGLTIADLAQSGEKEFALFAVRSGVSPSDLVLLGQSVKLEQQTGVNKELFFGLGRQHFTLSLPSILAQDPTARSEAFARAALEHQISDSAAASIPAALATLNGLAVQAALADPSAPDATTLGGLLGTFGLSTAKRTSLTNAFVAHSGTSEQFWAGVRQSGTLTSGEISTAQFALQLAVVTQNHLPLVKALKNKGVTALGGLAQFDRAGWLALLQSQVDGNVVGVPPDLALAGVSASDYAGMLFNLAENVAPTAALARQASTFPRGNLLTQFYSQNPSYEMRATTVNAFLLANPTALDFVTDPAERSAFLGQLKGMERLYRIAPAGTVVSSIHTLYSAGIASAQQINAMGRGSFLSQFGDVLGAGIADGIFAQASKSATASAALWARFSQEVDRTHLAVTPNPIDDIRQMPDYRTLFGSIDFCSCEQCQSALSPAAYLVDLLHWLDARPKNSAHDSPLTVLFTDRRGDIGTIELSCANTNTPLPYIDLVNEVLELLVAPGDVAYQTTGDAADLAAHPEHLRAEAYEVLAGAAAPARDGVYPFHLPFNLWLVEARTYLGNLGLPRHGLMEAFHPDGFSGALVDPEVAGEVLELSPLEASLISGETLSPARTPQDFWGLSGHSNWVSELGELDLFLEQAAPPLSRDGMSYEELTDLVKASFVQARGALGIWFNGSACDTSDASLPGLNQNHLTRLHRFVRLRRRLDWSAADLDRAIDVLGGGTLNHALLVKLAAVERLSSLLRLDVSALLSLWGLIDTRRWSARLVQGRPAGIPNDRDGRGFVFTAELGEAAEKGADQSPYDRLFLNRSVTAELNSAFFVSADGTALADETATLASESPAIQAALGVAAEELAKLLPLLPDGLLSLANLSILYRHVTLARALSLDAGSLVSLLALSGIDPFDPAHPENTVSFAEEVRAVRASGFSVAELDYLLRHLDTQPASLEPEDEPIGVLLLQLRDLLRKIPTDIPDAPADADEMRKRLAQELGKVLPADQVTPVLTLVDLAAGQAPPPGAEALIDAALSFFLDAESAKNALARTSATGFLSDRQARLAYVLVPLITYRRAQAVRSAVIDTLALNLGLSSAVGAPVFEEFIFYPDAGGQSMVALFSDPALVAYSDTEAGTDAPRVPGPADFAAQFAAYRRLHKVALVLARLRVKPEEVAWVLGAGPARGTLNFQTLPITPPAPADVQYGAWARLRDAFDLRDRVTGGRLFDLFEAAAVAQSGNASEQNAAFEALLDELIKRTRYERADLEFLAGAPARGATPAEPSALGLAYPDDFLDERGLARIDAAMTAVERVGLSAATLWPWRTIPGDTDAQAAQAADVKQAVRARLGEARFREATRPLRDELRERQRDALAGWLVAHGGFDDVLALFDELLLDVEMSACQLTSRIKQAVSSVQLFVQRALLNGEPDVRLSDSDARAWKWMKSYRLWEANRRVFLYPENYIEPELRDDKTPFFKELENELLQGDLDADAAETAVLGYLEKLDEVARLEIAGACRHVEDETNVLHVFGRTRSAPHRYFHRQWVDGSYWTPWEKVELDIEGDQLLPVVYNRRLYLFWLVISRTSVEEVIETPKQGGDNTQKRANRYFQIRVAWSEFRKGKWIGKKLSKAQIGATDDDYSRLTSALQANGDSQPAEFVLTSSLDGSDLLLEVVRSNPILSSQIPLIGKPQVVAVESNEATDRFRLSGCDGTMTLEPSPSTQTKIFHTPFATRMEAEGFTNPNSDSELIVPRRDTALVNYTNRTTLGVTPTPFRVVPSVLTGDWSSYPFFFEDLERTFFVVPDPPRGLIRGFPFWAGTDHLGLDLGSNLGDLLRDPPVFARPPIPVPDPWYTDPGAIVRAPPTLDLTTPAQRFSGDVKQLGGPLIQDSITSVVDALGPSVVSLGNAQLSFLDHRVSLDTFANIQLSDGTNMVFQSASGAELAAGRVQLRGDLSGSLGTYQRVPPSLITPIRNLPPTLTQKADGPFHFYGFYHPYVCRLIRRLNRFGLDELLDPAVDGTEPELVRQMLVEEFFDDTYDPQAVALPYPEDEFDFSYGGAYSAYNWELFFHVPFLVAVSLAKSQRFEDALRWFHYVFDPTASDDAPFPQRFWKIRPFFELFYGEDASAGPIQDLLLLLQYDGSDPDKLATKHDLENQLAALAKNPFNPHALARLRPVAYQKAVVLKYIDTLIEWGDDLFRRDTLESINEATLLYVLAARLLGPRPRNVTVDPPPPRSFNDLRDGLDAFSNALVEIEAYLTISSSHAVSAEDEPPPLGQTLFFCVPPNDKLVADGWDRVEDRLFKIRHCMNIEGVVRQLPLFEPPIEPSLLVRAAAAGIDLGSVLYDVGGALPLRRYAVLSQRALDLCNDVRALGSELLAALEKKDVEALALLRADHETRLLAAQRDVRQRQIDEASEQLESLKRSRELAEIRLKYYRSREFMNASEKAQAALLISAGLLDVAGGVVNLFGAAASAIPDVEVGAAGFGGTPVLNTKIGGTTISNVTSKVAEGLKVGASALDRAGNLAGIFATFQRRQDEWVFLGDQAQKEIEQIDRQILAAEIRVAIAEKELENQELQIEQSQKVEEFLQDKFTNQELYAWMVGQVSSLYFQSYKLAYDVARRAERAFQFELAQPTKSFIQFGYWDGLKKGLLAGERLHLDLQRMAAAHLEEDRREYELVRHVSLRLLDPVALISLRRDGECFVRIPEAWFDLDSPGHYLRRLKTVSVTVPCVTGPYVSVRLTLTLISSSVRTTPDATAPYGRTGGDDARFTNNVVGLQSIVTSQGVNDAGLFETNLHDERYLPFEGAGAISEWRLELPADFRQFDYETISDVVLHLSYTAREGGSLLKKAAGDELRDTLRKLVLPSLEARPDGQNDGLLQLVSARSDIPDVFHRFLHPDPGAPNQSLALELAPELFPFAVASSNLGIRSLDLFLLVQDTALYASGATVKLSVKPPSGSTQSVELTSTGEFGGLPHGIAEYGSNTSRPLGSWTVTFNEADNAAVAAGIAVNVDGHLRLNPSAIRDLFIVVRFGV